MNATNPDADEREILPAPAGRFGRSAGMLTGGVAAAGFLVYLYFALASRGLDGSDYGELVIVWAAVSISAAVIHRPIEQLLSRTVSEREARGESVREPIRVAAAIQLAVVACLTVCELAAREPLQDDLLSGNEALYWILVCATAAYAGGFFVRGLLAGRRRFVVYGAVLIAESVSRVLFALPLALGISERVSIVALGILAAPLVSFIALPAVLGSPSRAREHGARSATPPAAAGGFTVRHGGRFAAALMLILLSEQAFINGAPLLLGAISGAAAAGFIFNVLMVARAPALLFQAVSTSLLPHLTRLHTRDDPQAAAAFRRSVRDTMVGVAGFAVVVVCVSAAVGPQLMRIAFGEAHTYDRLGLVIVAIGMGFLLGATTLTQVAVAQGQVRRAAVRWAACAAMFLGWSMLPILDQFRRVEIGLAAATAVLFALLYVIYREPRAIPEDVPEPGSPEELEAQLAAAEEAS
jgi:O-antigen/teichoic acid export membrane protein